MPPPKKNFGLVCVLCVVLCVERPVTSTNCRCEVSRDNLHVQEGYQLHVDPSRLRVSIILSSTYTNTNTEIETETKTQIDREQKQQKQIESETETDTNRNRNRNGNRNR